MDRVTQYNLTKKEKEKAIELAEKHSGEGETIGLLLSIQRELGFLSREALEIASEKIEVPLSRLYGVATFYSQFSLHPRGKNLIRVCQGTACHVQGANQIADAVMQELDIDEGETTKDKQFTLEYVNCLGCCSLAPAVVLNGSKIYAEMDPRQVRRLIRSLRKGVEKKK